MLERERDNKLMNIQAATATMAHEVKQPLAVNLIETARRRNWLLNHTQPDRNVRSALVSIVANSHRAGQILNDTSCLVLEPIRGQANRCKQNCFRRCCAFFGKVEGSWCYDPR